MKISKHSWLAFFLLMLSSCNGADVSFMGFVEERIEPGVVSEETYIGTYEGKFKNGGNIYGKIINSQNSPLANAMVSFKKSDEDKWLSLQTDYNGNFKITNLKPGLYDFAFLAPGYLQNILAGVEISTGKNSENENLKITLQQ